MLPVVAIIGKPNVGKSTLFNRLVGYQKAVVSPVAGTTRDRHYAEIRGRKPFFLVDTGGIESKTDGVIERNVVAQAQIAIEEAQLILFLINVKENLTNEDFHVASLLRKSGKPVLLVASKSDSGQEDLSELLPFGFGEPLRVSAIHKSGMDPLGTEIRKKLPLRSKEKTKPEKNAIRLAILGRPNVGKSSLINSLIGEERVIVSEIQGTTVDSTDVSFEHAGTRFVLMDTPGIRRRGKIKKGIEKYSFLRSLRSSDTADVCVLLIDGKEGVTSQDQHVANYILQRYAGLILVVNKVDLLEKGEEARSDVVHSLAHEFEFVPWAPVVLISAKTGKNIEKILELAIEIKARRSHRIETPRLNQWLEKIILKHTPSGRGAKIPKLYYMTQVGVEPPHFVLFMKHQEYLHFSYLRYLENQLREEFGFEGTPIRFQVKNKTSTPRPPSGRK